MRVSVEVCVTSVGEAMAAERCGADSIELCTWLACGGVTPSIGLVQEVTALISIPLRILVRPTPGDFVYSAEEQRVILRDLDALAKTVGVHRIVIGALDANGLPDERFLEQAMAKANGLETTFHRAIDRSADLQVAFARCITMGIERILTSGGASLASDGTASIAWMVGQAPPGMRIAAAGGINADNVLGLVERTGVQEIHFAAQFPVEAAPERVALSSTHTSVICNTRPDVAKIEGVLNALSKAGLR
ncbi:MAG: copper homeostasis protein CutC [Flavobacteriales bacterium]